MSTDQGRDMVMSVEDCAYTVGFVQAFLHNELPEATLESIRLHLMACEHCLQHYDIEALIGELIRRSNQPILAPGQLRARIESLHIELTE